MPSRMLMPPARKNMTVSEGRGVWTNDFGSRFGIPPEMRPGKDPLEIEHGDEANQRHGERPEADPPEEVDRPLGVALKEADQDQVEHHVERPPQPVLGLAGGPGPMVHDLLGDPRSLPGGKDGNEPVHLAVQPDSGENPAAISLQSAAEVVERDSRDPGHQAVGDPRGDLAAEECVVAISPPAGDDVKALVQGLEQPGDVGGVVLAVAVDRHQDLAPRQVQCGRKRGGLTAVSPEEDGPHVLGIACLDALELGRRPVEGAVVDKDQLVASGEAGQARRRARHAAARRFPPRCKPESAPKDPGAAVTRRPARGRRSAISFPPGACRLECSCRSSSRCSQGNAGLSLDVLQQVAPADDQRVESRLDRALECPVFDLDGHVARCIPHR